MTIIKNTFTSLSLALVTTFGLTQNISLNAFHDTHGKTFPSEQGTCFETDPKSWSLDDYTNQKSFGLRNQTRISDLELEIDKQLKIDFTSTADLPFLRKRRNVYSSLWAFASINYLYADLVGLMDANILAQYQNGVVNGTKITPNFLTVAAGFMQIPIANVFLPHVIKNERALRWIQIASGSVMTLVQTATLFVGKPTPYYALFSAFEIAATTFITIDAIKWKPGSNKTQNLDL